MRTNAALTVSLLTPLLALAQEDAKLTREVTTSSAFWFWIIALALAVVAFIVTTVVISRRNWPSSHPRYS